MPRNMRQSQDLRDHADGRRASSDEDADAGAPLPLPVTVPPADPALGWAGWNAEGILPWADPPAEFGVRDRDEGDGDRPRRQPRQR